MDSNYINVFKAIAYSSEPVNVTTIMNEWSISSPTISRIINDMKSKGIVKLAGQEKMASGRNRNLYSLSPEYTSVITVFINKDDVKVFLTDFCGNVLSSEILSTTYQTCEQFVQQVFALIRKIIRERYPESDYKQFISCIGICVAGLVRYEEELVYTTIDYLEGWKNIEIKQCFEKEFGLKVFVEKDTVAGLLGAKRRFPLQNNIVFICIDVGVGFAVLINDSVYRGGNNFAGETGDMMGTDCGVRRIQCEAYELYDANTDSGLVSLIQKETLVIRGSEDFNLQVLDRAAMEGDYQVIELLVEPIHVWANMIVNICCCIDPELIVIGGQVTERTPYIVERLKANVERNIKRNVNIQSIEEKSFMDNAVNYFTVSSLYSYMVYSFDK